MHEILCGPETQLPPCDILTSGMYQMGFQLWGEADMPRSSWQVCTPHLQPGAKDALHYCGTQPPGESVLPDMVQMEMGSFPDWLGHEKLKG